MTRRIITCQTPIPLISDEVDIPYLSASDLQDWVISERVLPHLQSWVNAFYLDEKQVEQLSSKIEVTLKEPFAGVVIRIAVEQDHSDPANTFEDSERNWVIAVDHIAHGGKYDGGPFGFPYPNDAYERAFRVLKYVFDSLRDRGSFFAGLLGKQQTKRQSPTVPSNSSPPQRKILKQRVSSSNSKDGNTSSRYAYTVLHLSMLCY